MTSGSPGDRPVIGNDDWLYMISERRVVDRYHITVTKWTKDGSPVSSFILNEKATGPDVGIDEGGRILRVVKETSLKFSIPEESISRPSKLMRLQAVSVQYLASIMMAT